MTNEVDKLAPGTKIQLPVMLAIVLGALSLVLTATVIVGIFGFEKISEPAQVFSAVIGLIVVLGAFAALASYLRIASAEDAFGLPSGTVRAVIAIGLLIAVIVFGIGQLDRLSQTQFVPDTIIVKDADLLDPARPSITADAAVAERRRSLEAAGLVVKQVSRVGTATQFDVLRGPNPDLAPFSRELLTMMATLLTSILAFYFGSRASERKSDRKQIEEMAQELATARKGVDDDSVEAAAKLKPVTVTGKKISFGVNYISSEEGGLDAFAVGDKVAVSGAVDKANNVPVTVKAVAPGQIIVEEQLIAAAVPLDARVITLTKQL